MKKAILIASFLVLGIVANAQNQASQIDTTDATIKYLLERVDKLEHELWFTKDESDLEHMALKLEIKLNEIHNAVPTIEYKNAIKRYLDAAERNYKSLCTLASLHMMVYNYSEAERNQLTSASELIDLSFKMMREWLRGY